MEFAAGVVALLALGLPLAAGAQQQDKVLRVCADPSNLPLSNDKGEGYENKIAAAMAHDLGLEVQYTFFPQRMGFVRNTLRKKDEQTQKFLCDLIIGVPKDYDITATTQPYMHSTYELVYSKKRTDFDSLKVADDLLKLPQDKRAKLKIGVFDKTPGSDWALKNAFMDHAQVFAHQNGDALESPARTMERALNAGDVDGVILWGPIAGMLVNEHKDGSWRAVPFNAAPGIKFDYEISMGVRQADKDLKETLDGWIGSHRPQIDAILKSYQIPVVDASGNVQM
jgi:quinoprotein dehydrogenase-associated probable ABC transporter substrate-binding protein